MLQHKSSLISHVVQLWGHLLPRRRKQLVMLGVLMILASFAEVVSIGAVLPFLSVLTSPESVFAHQSVRPIVTFLRLQAAQDLLLPFTIFFILTAIFAGLVRIILIWAQTRLSMAIGADFSVQVYERTLYQPYSIHVGRNSSDILAGARKAENLVHSVIQPVLLIISSSVILLSIISALLVIQPVIALSAFLGFGFIYAAVVAVTKHKIGNNSQIIATHQAKITKAIQEGLGGIRDVLLDGTQSVYSKLYRDAFIPMQSALASNQVTGLTPRFGVEALAMVLIAGLAYVLSAGKEMGGAETNAIPALGALALGTQRLLPVLQQIYNSYINIRGSQASITDALDLLDQKIPDRSQTHFVRRMEFRTCLQLKDISYRYTQESPWVLRNLNLEILKGSRFGIVGATGSGKSTLLDLLMSLLTPTEGVLLVDKTVITLKNARAWQANISHVPQSIYLADTSIAENIAFGVPLDLIDLERVRKAAEQAQIAETIESWTSGYGTLVGERGLRLSGGQRQRIGIARALYKRSNLLIFDEATSALDEGTESSVMQSIDSLAEDLTLIFVTHRINTLRNCDNVVELKSIMKP